MYVCMYVCIYEREGAIGADIPHVPFGGGGMGLMRQALQGGEAWMWQPPRRVNAGPSPGE